MLANFRAVSGSQFQGENACKYCALAQTQALEIREEKRHKPQNTSDSGNGTSGTWILHAQRNRDESTEHNRIFIGHLQSSSWPQHVLYSPTCGLPRITLFAILEFSLVVRLELFLMGLYTHSQGVLKLIPATTRLEENILPSNLTQSVVAGEPEDRVHSFQNCVGKARSRSACHF